MAPITYLLGNDYEKVDLDSLELTIGTVEEPICGQFEDPVETAMHALRERLGSLFG